MKFASLFFNLLYNDFLVFLYMLNFLCYKLLIGHGSFLAKFLLIKLLNVASCQLTAYLDMRVYRPTPVTVKDTCAGGEGNPGLPRAI